MSRKPRAPRPFNLHIAFNVKEKMYEIYEDNLLYAFPFNLLQHVKKTIGWGVSVADWYQRLNNDDKKQVIVLGKPKEDLNIFD